MATGQILEVKTIHATIKGDDSVGLNGQEYILDGDFPIEDNRLEDVRNYVRKFIAYFAGETPSVVFDFELENEFKAEKDVIMFDRSSEYQF